MCIANAYLKQGAREDIFLEEVALIRSERGKLILRTLFGEERSIVADIKEVNFESSKVLLEKRE